MFALLGWIQGVLNIAEYFTLRPTMSAHTCNYLQAPCRGVGDGYREFLQTDHADKHYRYCHTTVSGACTICVAFFQAVLVVQSNNSPQSCTSLGWRCGRDNPWDAKTTKVLLIRTQKSTRRLLERPTKIIRWLGRFPLS